MCVYVHDARSVGRDLSCPYSPPFVSSPLLYIPLSCKYSSSPPTYRTSWLAGCVYIYCKGGGGVELMCVSRSFRGIFNIRRHSLVFPFGTRSIAILCAWVSLVYTQEREAKATPPPPFLPLPRRIERELARVNSAAIYPGYLRAFVHQKYSGETREEALCTRVFAVADVERAAAGLWFSCRR